MKGQEFIIKFLADKAYLTEEYYLTLPQVDIPENTRNFKNPAYWKFRVINHIREENRIFCEIINYCVGEVAFAENQIRNEENLKQIKKVTFRTINTVGLLKTSSGNHDSITFNPPKPELIKENKTKTNNLVNNYNTQFFNYAKDYQINTDIKYLIKNIKYLGN